MSYNLNSKDPKNAELAWREKSNIVRSKNNIMWLNKTSHTSDKIKNKISTQEVSSFIL